MNKLDSYRSTIAASTETKAMTDPNIYRERKKRFRQTLSESTNQKQTIKQNTYIQTYIYTHTHMR